MIPLSLRKFLSPLSSARAEAKKREDDPLFSFSLFFARRKLSDLTMPFSFSLFLRATLLLLDEGGKRRVFCFTFLSPTSDSRRGYNAVGQYSLLPLRGSFSRPDMEHNTWCAASHPFSARNSQAEAPKPVLSFFSPSPPFLFPEK